MLLVTRQLNGKEWITIQDKCMHSALRDYDMTDYSCVGSGLSYCEKAGHFSMAGLAVSAKKEPDTQILIFKVRKFTSDFLDCLATYIE